METCSTRMWMLSLTRGTETSSRGGCCCHREFRVPSSAERVTSRFKNWGAEARSHSAAQSKLAQVVCRFVRSSTSQASACSGVHRNGRFAAVSVAHSLSHASAAIVLLPSPSSARARAAFHRSGLSPSCRMKHGRSITMEKSDSSDFGVRCAEADDGGMRCWNQQLPPSFRFGRRVENSL